MTNKKTRKMKALTINVPNEIDLDARETSKFLAAKLYETGRLTLGQAAAMAGLSKIAFAEILSDYDVSYELNLLKY